MLAISDNPKWGKLMKRVFIFALLLSSLGVFADDGIKIIATGYYDRNATMTSLPDGSALYIGEKVLKFDANNSKWTQVASLNIPRVGHRDTLLKDGRVLVIGGWAKANSKTSKYVYQPEIYDPKANSWSLLPASTEMHSEGAVVQITDSKILIVGRDRNRSPSGWQCNNGDVLDLQNMTWTDVESPDAYCPKTKAYKMASGKIMVLSEVNSFPAQIFDPSTNKWTQIPSPRGNNGISGITADQKVFVGVNAGGATWKQPDEMKLLEWNEGESRWIQVTDMVHARAGDDAGAFGLSDGRFVFFSRRSELVRR